MLVPHGALSGLLLFAWSACCVFCIVTVCLVGHAAFSVLLLFAWCGMLAYLDRILSHTALHDVRTRRNPAIMQL
ncbi:hypothetical protein J6TS7_09960 [Paenibacillus dendritiformis]|nr:hypothetical protein J6TS7_09960 [Paenibacillus dendritiformis]